jgi:hypothetical protein
VLRRVPNENTAQQLYGQNWKTKIMDVPDVFWGDYSISSDELAPGQYPLGSLIKYSNKVEVYLLSAQGKRHLTNEYAFYDNEYYWTSVLEIPETYQYNDDSKINFREDSLNNPYYVSGQ